jgi:hypothetical protein
LIYARAELDPDFVIHVLRADVRDLFATQVGELPGLRHSGEQLLDADLPAGIPGLNVAARRAGNRAAVASTTMLGNEGSFFGASVPSARCCATPKTGVAATSANANAIRRRCE